MKEDTCSKLNPWFASEVYQDVITIGDWKDLKATQDKDYNTVQLEEIRCWIWGSVAKNSIALKKMGGMDKCTTALLTAIDAKDIAGKPMGVWFPQDYKFGDSTQKCIHFTYIFQVFVILQLFNQINSRFIQEGEFNILKGFFSNKMFLIVYLFEWVF